MQQEETIMRTIKPWSYSGNTSDQVTKRELEHRKIARDVAAQGMVLLENDGVLPLKRNKFWNSSYDQTDIWIKKRSIPVESSEPITLY